MNLKDYPKWDNPLREPILYRRNNRIRMRRMRTYRSVPKAARAWFVTLTVIQAAEDEFGRDQLVAGLTWEPQAFWCRHRRTAKRFVERDQAAGGQGSMFEVEHRLCPVCGRLLLGPEATEYRLKQMKPVRLWHFPQGPACNMDCKPHGRGKDGQPIKYNRKKAA